MTGIVLFFVEGASGQDEAESEPSARLVPWLGGQGAGVSAEMRF